LSPQFWNNLDQVHTNAKEWKAKQFTKIRGARKPMGLNRIDKID
jgi:hypothetical protein